MEMGLGFFPLDYSPSFLEQDKNGSISEDEFVQMMSNWLKECRQEGSTQGNGLRKSGWWTPRRKILNEGIDESSYST